MYTLVLMRMAATRGFWEEEDLGDQIHLVAVVAVVEIRSFFERDIYLQDNRRSGGRSSSPPSGALLCP